MGIDGIGRGGGRPVSGVGAADAPNVAPEVGGPSGPEAAASSGSEAVAGTGPLAQLQRGEIDLARYLDLRVADAVSPYVGKVPDAQLDFIRDSLRDALASDPVVVELVRRTTGVVPAVTD
jgi:hypothetical protein